MVEKLREEMLAENAKLKELIQTQNKMLVENTMKHVENLISS